MITIKKAKSLKGTIRVPGDKSITHRSIMLGAIAEGDTFVRGYLKSADCMATIDCFSRMGISVETRHNPLTSYQDDETDNAALNSTLVIHGNGLRGLSAPEGIELYAANSGTTVRLLAGILAGQSFKSHISGDASLSRRPMKRIIEPLSRMGVLCVSDNDDDRLPMTIKGGQPNGIHYESRVASAQVKSCVLLAGLYADEATFYTEPVLSRNHTELMLGACGANLKTKKRPGSSAVTTILYPGPSLKALSITIPGDISSAAYFLAAGLITEDSEITITGVGINETRDGILRVIRAMGGDMTMRNIRIEGSEPVADITVRSSDLHGTEIRGAIIPTLIDELPVIAVMAACAEGTTVIRDAGELRVKESDRLSAIVEGLRSMDIRVDSFEDGMAIHGGELRGSDIDPLGDHRLAMAFSVAGLVSRKPVRILDERCVNISYPTFFEDLERLQGKKNSRL